MGYATGTEWIWFLLGIGFITSTIFVVFTMVMITKFYCMLKKAIENENEQISSKETAQ